jgi:DNA-binding protein HU-beta
MASGMTKTQLTRHLAEKLGSNNKTAATFLEHLADTAIKETKKNGVFVVPGLGRLVKAHRKARMGRNPQTGEPIQIKAKTRLRRRSRSFVWRGRLARKDLESRKRPAFELAFFLSDKFPRTKFSTRSTPCSLVLR